MSEQGGDFKLPPVYARTFLADNSDCGFHYWTTWNGQLMCLSKNKYNVIQLKARI